MSDRQEGNRAIVTAATSGIRQVRRLLQEQGDEMTQRQAFVLNVRPGKVDDYIGAHANVWPEMLEAVRDAGVRNYSIFRHGNQMFGYFETDDVEHVWQYLASQRVNKRWQDAMSELLEERVADAGPGSLEEIFRLD